MILASLVRFYDRLYAEGARIPREGWEDILVRYLVDLNDDGSVNKITSTRKTERRKDKKGKEKEVDTYLSTFCPFHSNRSNNYKAFAYCDKSDYIFGINEDGFVTADGEKSGKYEKEKPKLMKRFETAKKLAHRLLDEVDSPAAKAYLTFYDTWDYEQVEFNSEVQSHPEIFTDTGNFLFTYRDKPVTEYQEFIDAYDAYMKEVGWSESEMFSRDMITGEQGRICRVHRQLNGALGFNSTGASFCCSNTPSTKSYGREQGYGFPMTETTAFKYAIALNYLIKQRGIHSFSENLSQITYVFWSETASELQDKAVMSLLSGTIDPEIKTNREYIQFIESVCRGYPVNADSVRDPENPVYHVIGLDTRDGSNARIRFELESDLVKFAESVIQHYSDCAIDGYDGIMTPRKIVYECSPKKSDNSIKDDGSRVYNDILNAITHGYKYPEHMTEMLLKRISIESVGIKTDTGKISSVTAPRAALLRAILIRNYNRKDTSMALDIENKDPAYVLGRYLAVAENIQYTAMDRLGKTLPQRYMREMMYYPNVVLPEITAKVTYYITKISRNSPGLATILEGKCMELTDMMPENGYPNRFTAEQSCAFLLGYYHQKSNNIACARNAKELADKKDENAA